MLGSETFMFGMIERFNRQVFAIQRFGAGGRGKVLDIILRLGLSGKPAEPIFGHVRRGMPKSQPDGAALKNSQGAMSDLVASGKMGGTLECHRISLQSMSTIEIQYNKVAG